MDIFVSNLPFKLTEKELQDLFEPFGTVESVKIVLDHKIRQSKGFGFVSMPNHKEAKSAIKKLRGHKINDRSIIVSPASSKENKPEEEEKPKEHKPFWKRKIKQTKSIVSFDGAHSKPKKGTHKKRRGQGRGTKY